MNKLASMLVVSLILGGCQAQEATPPAENAVAVATTTDQPEEVTPPASAEDMFAAKLDGVLAGDWRSEQNAARDKYRHPQQTLGFFGIAPGMTVIEITPGGGWYAEVLAPWMKGTGNYVAAVSSADPESERASPQQRLEKRFATDPLAFDEAKIVVFDSKAPSFGAPGSADRVLTFRNVHNWVMGGYAPAMFKGFFAVLKPGGVLGVADHRASDGKSLDEVKNSGYLPTDYVIKLATDAGFKLDARSEINANPNDTHDHPKGVWTLPPTLALGDTDRAKYLAIGESDRMTLRFVKPLPDTIKTTGMDKAPAAAVAH